MPEFKFQVGQLVRVAGSLDRFQVIELISTQWSGGTESVYLGRLYYYNDSFSVKEESKRYIIDGRQLYRLHECELVAIE